MVGQHRQVTLYRSVLLCSILLVLQRRTEIIQRGLPRRPQAFLHCLPVDGGVRRRRVTLADDPVRQAEAV